MLVILFLLATSATASLRPGWAVGSVSQPLVAADGTEYLIFLPPTWKNTTTHPVMLFLHGVGGINNGNGCRDPGLKSQFPLLDPTYAAKVAHIVLVPVAKQPNWRHHFTSAMALVDMAITELAGDASRVAIAGQSMGGHGAWLYASQLAPGRFCAVIVMCGYLDEDGPIGDSVPDVIVEPLKSVPIWIFHSEVDDATPPPGRPQDDSRWVAAAFHAVGNPNVKHTRYPADLRPPHYIPGHAAFEMGFHEEALWAWLDGKSRPLPIDPSSPVVRAAAGVLVLLLLLFSYAHLPRLAFLVSTLTLVLSSVAYLGLMQAEGGLLDSCLGFAFAGVSFEQCRALGASVIKNAADGTNAAGYFAMVVSKARAENCFALGMGAGGVFALLFRAKGTKEVAVVHLMQSIWAASVCLVNAQNAGLLASLHPLLSAEASIDFASQAALRPFVLITGAQALLGLSSFLLSRSLEPVAAFGATRRGKAKRA